MLLDILTLLLGAAAALGNPIKGEEDVTALAAIQVAARAADCPTLSPNCQNFYTVVTGDFCYAIAGRFNISLDQFYKCNPGVNSPSCNNLTPGCSYCVGSCDPNPVVFPNPHQPDINPGCKRFYQAVMGDSCWLVATKYGLSLNDFLSWNPDVGVNCQAMLAGWWYCIAV